MLLGLRPTSEGDDVSGLRLSQDELELAFT